MPTISCLLIMEEQHVHIVRPNMLISLALTALVTLASSCLSADELPDQGPPQLPVLTAENGQYTVFDPLLNEHSFTQHDNNELIANANTSGTLVHLDGQHYRWTDDNGKQHRFEGSQYVGLERDAEALECLPLPDPDNQPVDPTSDLPGTTEEGTEEATTENTEELTESGTEEESQCDVETHGAHSFSTPVYTGGLTLLDARPASCESYFVQYYGTQRGSEIETGLRQHSPYQNMTATLRTFPVIDFYDDNALYVVHSRDLGNRTFNSPNRPNALLDQLLEDGEQIQTRFTDVVMQEGSVTASELGNSTTISDDQLRPVTLQLIIRDGIASTSHWQQIAQADKTLQARYGITLEVVVIP